ncbi:hypothetical protein B0T10DRAFT_271548 [Thelonectria olida]|uniref:Uncharacterized protein n=1 Tax=Thelonectria olida TaxID=1576542 RepID=A0A9P8W9N6_9HYPO|nr:hypothetical protein B0T10DRAFT_271548 [Thelonectria olida]
MWTPIWLTKFVLIVFAIGFWMMLLATGLLFHFSVENDGISVQKEANHYAWKYGPTALLVVVGTLWKQVDHHNKMLMPWKELQRGPASAQKTLLLDYISPILPTALWAAIKNRHWAVVMSLAGHLLILGTTIFSTGLLILEPTEITKKSGDFSVKGVFRIDDPQSDQALKLGPAPAQLYYGINFQGLQYPAGTSEDAVLPVFEAPKSSADNINYTLTTEGMKIGLDCELLDITNGTQVSMPWYSILGSFFVADVKTSDCNIKGVMIGAGPDHGYYHVKNATQNYQGFFDVYPCNVDFNFATDYIRSSNSKEYKEVYNATADQRVVLSVADLRFAPYNVSMTTPRFLYVHEVKAALCKPSYNLQNFQVKSEKVVSGSPQAVLSTAAKAKEKMVSGLPLGSVALGVLRSSNLFTLGSGGEDYVLSQQVPTFFQLMSMKNGNTSIGAFLDPDLLMKTGEEVFKGIATQALQQLAIKPADRQVNGHVTYTENRLHVKALSTIFMCSFFALLTLLSIGMMFVRPHSVIPREPGSITATATILAASPGLQRALARMGASRMSHIRKRLEAFTFRSAVVSGQQPAFTVEAMPLNKDASFEQPETTEQAIHWWRPVSGKSWYLGSAIVLPLVLIAALEIVQHFSDKNDGFVNVGPKNSIVLATYIPAAVFLGVASMYSALELTAAIFTPFDALRRRKATADRSIHLNLVGKLLPHAVFLSLKTRHFAVFIALIGNFIGGFLTIVVSGLYSSAEVPKVHNLTLQQTDQFSFDNVDLSLDDNQAAAVDSLIEYLNLDYPKWTYKDLAFNHFKAPPLSSKNSSARAPLAIEVPATRAKLNCTTVPSNSRQVSIIEDDQGGGTIASLPGSSIFFTPVEGYIYVGFNTTLKFSDYCERVPSKNVSEAYWMQYFMLPINKAPAYVGKGSVMQWYSDGVMGDGALDTNPTSGTGLGANGLGTGNFGCPTFAVTLGTSRVTGMERDGNITRYSIDHDFGTALCYQNVEEVTTNLTWNLPEFDLAGSLPTVNESSASLIKTINGSERHEFAVNAWLMGFTDSVFNRSLPGPDNSSYLNNYVDSFINGLVNSKDGELLENLVGEKNVANLTTMSDRLYRGYMAQAISFNMRENTTKLPSYTGTVTQPGFQRLQQNRGPKIALQVMLAIMVATAIGMSLLLQIREVLPHDPCSIAGTATMLAGAEMATSQFIPLGSEWQDHRGLKNMGIFESFAYTLTWWVEYGGDYSANQRYGVDRDIG